MAIQKQLHRPGIVVITSVFAMVLLLVGVPKSTQNMMVNSKLSRLLPVTKFGANRIVSYQLNPNLPIDASGSQPYRIVHIGDSHVQAGFFTGEVRRLLSNFSNESVVSIGYVFPYNLAGTNSPQDYTFKSSSKWTFRKILGSEEPIAAGLSGMIMETTDINPSLFVSLRSAKLGDKCFDEITLLSNAFENGFTVELEGVKSEVILSDKNQIKLKLENSVNEANIVFGNQGCDATNLKISGFILENSSSKVIYNSAGLNGADVKSYLRASELEYQMGLINPQLVIISLGTNDAYHPLFDINLFTAMLNSLVAKVKQAAPDATVLLTIPGDHLVSRLNLNPRILQAKEAIISVAAENNCCVWDFHSLMGGEGGIKVWNSMGLTAPDLLHLNAKGYQLQGELLFEALTSTEL